MTHASTLLVGHGETAWNRERRVQGWAGRRAVSPNAARSRHAPPDAGSATARLLGRSARRLEPPSNGRDRPTAPAGGIDAEVEFDRDWRERDFGRQE